MTTIGWKSGVLTLDYDEVQIDKVRDDICRLQNKYELSDATIFRSSQGDNYHVYFWMEQNLSRDKEIEIIKDSEFVDEEFQQFQENRDKTRMRVKGKHDKEIEEVGVVESTYDGQGQEQRAEHLIRTFKRMKKIT